MPSVNVRSAALITSSVALVAVVAPAPSYAAGTTVHQEQVCVVATHGDGTKGHYLLTQRVVTQLDEAGQPVPGSGKADPWKRWPRRDYRTKWTTYCG
jgi:hypothetical protein